MEKPFPAYSGDEPYVFVSYAHGDDAKVYPEIQWLHDQGFNVYYDEGLSPGSEWRDELARSIAGAALVLFFVTPTSVERPHCQREVHFALEEERPLLAVHLAPTELPDGLRLSLNTIQAIFKYEIGERDYRLKLLRGVSEHVDRGTADAQSVRVVQGFSAPTMALSVLLAIGLSSAAWWFFGARGELVEAQPARPIPPIVRTTIEVPPDVERIDEFFLEGETLVYFAFRGRQYHLFSRSLDNAETIELPLDAEFVVDPFLSPDGEWLGYRDLRDGDYMRIRTDGTSGPIEIVPTDIPSGWARADGAAWGPDDRIVFSDWSTPGLKSASTFSSLAAALTVATEGKHHTRPSFLPNGDILLNVQEGSTLRFGLAVYSAADRSITPLLTPRAMTAPGFVLLDDFVAFSPDGRNLLAARYDAATQRLGAHAAIHQVDSYLLPISVSRTTDRLVQRHLSSGHRKSTLVWIDPDNGTESNVPLPPDYYREPRISPDGTEIAFILDAEDPGDGDSLVVYSIVEKHSRRVLADERHIRSPVWTPDGTELFFSRVDDDADIYRIDAHGMTEPIEIHALEGDHRATAATGNGQTLLYDAVTFAGSSVVSLSLETGEYDLVVPDDGSPKFAGRVSPDDRLVAYSSFANGISGVYVKTIDDDSPPILIGKGSRPIWGVAGRRLYFRTDYPEHELRSIAMVDGAPSGEAVVHFLTWGYRTAPGAPNYDAAPDGSLLMVKLTESPVVPFTLVQNWFANVRDTIPPIE